MIVPKNSVLMNMTIPEGVLNVRSTSVKLSFKLSFESCLMEDVETLHEGKVLVSFNIIKALTGIASAVFGVKSKSVFP